MFGRPLVGRVLDALEQALCAVVAGQKEHLFVRRAALVVALRALTLREAARRGAQFGPEFACAPASFAFAEASRVCAGTSPLRLSRPTIFGDPVAFGFDGSERWLEPRGAAAASSPLFFAPADAVLSEAFAVADAAQAGEPLLAPVRSLGDFYEQALVLVAPGEHGRGVATPSTKRRELAAHHTPPEFVRELVRPLVRLLARDVWERSGRRVDAHREALLGLRIVDPAMGSAPFLGEVAREIALEIACVERLGEPSPGDRDDDREEQLDRRAATKVVAAAVERVVFGVDVDPLVVELARLSLALLTLPAGSTETLRLNDAHLRCGDALVSDFDGAPFDGLVMNPPFRGDRDLRELLSEAGVERLRRRFGREATPDLAGYFVWLAAELVGPRGAIAALLPNTAAQGKNRRVVLEPLVFGDDARFVIARAVRSRPWPGDAMVHVCMLHLARPSLPVTPLLVRYDGNVETRTRVARISSALDAQADAPTLALASMSEGIAQTGMFVRGNLDRPLSFAAEVPPPERGALFAYLNNEDILRQRRPVARRVVIDFYDALAEAGLLGAAAAAQERFLAERFPFLYASAEATMRAVRRALAPTRSNREARERWFLFQNPRPELRSALRRLPRVIVFGRVSKVFCPMLVPVRDAGTGLPICPTEQLNVAPSDSSALAAVLQSMVFECHLRRVSSTLGVGLRASPREAFPGFPLPWPPHIDAVTGAIVALPAPADVEARLGPAFSALASHREGLLANPEKHGLGAVNGPTGLYNLFDTPTETNSAIEELRALHRRLTDAVIAEYGWSTESVDGPPLRPHWGFSAPWVDGTTRYVPAEADLTLLRCLLGARLLRAYRDEQSLTGARRPSPRPVAPRR